MFLRGLVLGGRFILDADTLFQPTPSFVELNISIKWFLSFIKFNLATHFYLRIDKTLTPLSAWHQHHCY